MPGYVTCTHDGQRFLEASFATSQVAVYEKHQDEDMLKSNFLEYGIAASYMFKANKHKITIFFV